MDEGFVSKGSEAGHVPRPLDHTNSARVPYFRSIDGEQRMSTNVPILRLLVEKSFHKPSLQPLRQRHGKQTGPIPQSSHDLDHPVPGPQRHARDGGVDDYFAATTAGQMVRVGARTITKGEMACFRKGPRAEWRRIRLSLLASAI